jgi:hypothetical protein
VRKRRMVSYKRINREEICGDDRNVGNVCTDGDPFSRAWLLRSRDARLAGIGRRRLADCCGLGICPGQSLWPISKMVFIRRRLLDLVSFAVHRAWFQPADKGQYAHLRDPDVL